MKSASLRKIEPNIHFVVTAENSALPQNKSKCRSNSDHLKWCFDWKSFARHHYRIAFLIDFRIPENEGGSYLMALIELSLPESCTGKSCSSGESVAGSGTRNVSSVSSPTFMALRCCFVMCLWYIRLHISWRRDIGPYPGSLLWLRSLKKQKATGIIYLLSLKRTRKSLVGPK